MGEVITVDGRLLSGPDDYGDWKTTTLQGWWDRPAKRSDSVERVGAHGKYMLPRFYESRMITVGGRVITKSHEHQHAAMDRLAGMLTNGPGRMRVAGHGATQWAVVEMDREVRFNIQTDTYVQWQFTLEAVDPRRFGAVRSLSAGAGTATEVQNRGNFPASPLIVVEGPVTAGGYTVTGPGGELFTVTTSPGAGTTHLIDMHDGLLRVNGSMAAGAGLVSRADVFTIPAGGKANVTLSKGGRVELYDTYM